MRTLGLPNFSLPGNPSQSRHLVVGDRPTSFDHVTCYSPIDEKLRAELEVAGIELSTLRRNWPEERQISTMESTDVTHNYIRKEVDVLADLVRASADAEA